MSTDSESTSTPPSELVAGFLAVISLAASGLAIFWDPFRATPFAVILALIAISGSALAFVIGMTIAVTTNHAVY